MSRTCARAGLSIPCDALCVFRAPGSSFSSVTLEPTPNRSRTGPDWTTDLSASSLACRSVQPSGGLSAESNQPHVVQTDDRVTATGLIITAPQCVATKIRAPATARVGNPLTKEPTARTVLTAFSFSREELTDAHATDRLGVRMHTSGARQPTELKGRPGLENLSIHDRQLDQDERFCRHPSDCIAERLWYGIARGHRGARCLARWARPQPSTHTTPEGRRYHDRSP